ncbi:MAG: hypothetical protein Q7U77_01780 [Sediminibacterium sp.]|uniref:hypothetical protein n=1 Tax=Sediminibacterium sp. TaxID=1917865 RepID=UPI00271F2968|nr:hypothetical protein [Sediminibacterium sp.]MDO8995333.1 hypothetical protein [Sediminibacterium sp.]
MKFNCLLLFLLFFYTNKSNAFDTTIVTQLLQRIDQLQVKENGIFPKGLFPSYRTYALNQDRQKADINPFFTGLIVFTLDRIKDQLTPYQQKLVEQISLNAKPVFKKFKNRKDRDTYNFWPTDSAQIFPNSGWMNLFNKSQSLPDDMDDTVIILMALKANEKTADNIHLLMQDYINGGKGKINNTFSSISHLPAYSVWFGNRMPVDFDISVLSNVLYFVQEYKLPFTKADSSSVQLIVKVLEEKKHITAPSFISPHYGSSEIILYHLSRLMALKPIPELEKFKPMLIQQALEMQEKQKPFLLQVLLSSTLLNWGIKPSLITVNKKQSLTQIIEDEQFSFFIANMASMLPNQLKKSFTTSKLGTFKYYCPAYNNVLLLENIILHQKLVN